MDNHSEKNPATVTGTFKSFLIGTQHRQKKNCFLLTLHCVAWVEGERGGPIFISNILGTLVYLCKFCCFKNFSNMIYFLFLLNIWFWGELFQSFCYVLFQIVFEKTSTFHARVLKLFFNGYIATVLTFLKKIIKTWTYQC